MTTECKQKKLRTCARVFKSLKFESTVQYFVCYIYSVWFRQVDFVETFTLGNDIKIADDTKMNPITKAYTDCKLIFTGINILSEL